MDREMHSGDEVYRDVLAEFVRKGTTLNAWCKHNHVTLQYAEACLKGRRNGPSARRLKRRIVRTSGAHVHVAAA